MQASPETMLKPSGDEPTTGQQWEVQANNGRRQLSHGLNDALASAEDWHRYEGLSTRVVDRTTLEIIEAWGTQGPYVL